MEAEQNEDKDVEEDTSKILEQIVRKRTISAQSNGDSELNVTDEEKKMNGESKMNGEKKGKGIGD